MNTLMLGDKEWKISVLSRSRSTSSMFQATDGSTKNEPKSEPKAKPQTQPLVYLPSHILSGETAQNGRLRSQSSPGAPLRPASSYQPERERSETASPRLAGSHPRTMGHGIVPGARRPLEINTRDLVPSSLTASKDRSLPESPGFPTMLAAMTFPIPPTTSRPSTADACVGSTTCFPPSMTTPPAILPRTSSKRATSSNGARTTSMDDLVMQPTSSTYRPSDPWDTSHIASKPERLAITTTVTRSARSATIGEMSRPAAMGSLRPRASSVASSTRVDHDARGSPSIISADSNSPRASLNINEPYNIPIGIAISSPRDLAPNADRPFSHPEGTRPHLMQPVPTISLTLPSPYEEKYPNRQGLLAKCSEQKVDIKSVSSKPTSIPLNKEANLDFIPFIPSTDESKDSPILGRFLGSTPLAKKQLSKSSQAQENSFIPTNNEWLRTTSGGTTQRIVFTSEMTVPERNWSLSEVMTINITPERPPENPILPRIAITPVMVVANLTPQPESTTSTLSSSVIPTPLRPSFHKLKIIPQSRPKPVPIMVHKSVTAGHGESITGSPGKLNRHTVTGVLTPPKSPNSGSPKRNSHPVESRCRVPSGTVGKPIPKTSPRVHLELNQGEGKEKAWPVPSTKERLEKAKLAREEEIVKLVERMLGVAKAKEVGAREEWPNSQWEHTEEQIEKRLQRLEEDGDACLRDVKSALQNMSKTLDELRKESGNKRLIMNEFNV